MTRLGQHFLKNEEILEKLIELGEIKPTDIVLEPGCGDGKLTEKLAKQGCKVIAIEIDEKLASIAANRLAMYDNVRLIIGDLLRVKPTGFNKVIGNPPYYISSRLIHWLITGPMPELMVMTLQREFAEKLCARPKQDNYVYLSVLTQLFYDVKVYGVAPRRYFSPPPKVSSRIVIMRRKPKIHPNILNHIWLIKNLFTRKRHLIKRELKKLDIEIPPQLIGKRIYEIDVENYYNLLSKLTPQ
ncbi:MAG: 16S rRNA (adenine(1518)-N(6)/adenine(1519)-N(6))-dimethyltransferase RsmA [Nitrososphaerota archaeon]